MAKLEHVFEVVEVSAPGTLGRCAELLAERGWRVRRSKESVSATRGSQFRMRLFGTWSLNVDPNDLPQELILAATGDALRVTLRDRIGIGVLDHRTKEKYELAFADAEALVRSACT